jgi:hypothetical protein
MALSVRAVKINRELKKITDIIFFSCILSFV